MPWCPRPPFSYRTQERFRSPENVLIYDDQSFWTPAQSDRAPFLVFTLPKEDVFQSCAISEFEESVQIENFAIDVKTESGEWRELITLHKQERRKTFSAKFRKNYRERIPAAFITRQPPAGLSHPNFIFFFILKYFEKGATRGALVKQKDF